jgi:hypothetical protein
MSSSGPYIYNPKECVILAYKKHHIRTTKGETQWKGTLTEIETKEGVKRNKMLYDEKDKKEFMELVYGQWKYFADTKQMTKATFSMDIPTRAIKILTFATVFGNNFLTDNLFSQQNKTFTFSGRLEQH